MPGRAEHEEQPYPVRETPSQELMNILNSSTSNIIPVILLGLVLSVLLSWISVRLAKKIGLIDWPGSASHKLHSQPTPLSGGFAILGAVGLSALFLGTYRQSSIRAIVFATLVVFTFGIWDDYRRLSPPIKLVGQLLAAAVLIYQGVYVRIFESPEFFISLGGNWDKFLNIAITLLWLVGITNAFNFVDSMDGLAVGLGGMAAAFFMLVTFDSQQPLLSWQNAALLGTCLGIYFFNSTPAIMFLGDSGAQSLGFILAALGIVYQPLGANQSSSWLVPILLLGVPIFDTSMVILSRLRRGRPVYQAGRDHTYHRLIALGLPPNRAVLIMQGTALVLGCLAYICLNLPPTAANGIFGLVVAAGIVAFIYLDHRQRWSFGPE